MDSYRSFVSEAPDRFTEPSEKHLAIAVMMTAIDDLVKHRGNFSSEADRNHRDAERWVLSNDETWPYSFVNLCALLNLPVGELRTKLLGSPDAFRGLLGEIAA